MIQVHKEEAQAVRENFPEAFITITGRQSNHKKYYVPEEPDIVKFVDARRKANIVGCQRQRSE